MFDRLRHDRKRRRPYNECQDCKPRQAVCCKRFLLIQGVHIGIVVIAASSINRGLCEQSTTYSNCSIWISHSGIDSRTNLCTELYSILKATSPSLSISS